MTDRYPTVLEHPRFLVIPRPGSRKLAIFFSGTGTKDFRFHFYGQAQKCGANVILLNNGCNAWYQSGIEGLGPGLERTIETLRAWARALDAPEIHCIGASMGGSGAALYGCLLDAAVLAFGFEARLGLPSSRSAKLRPADCALPIPDLTPLIAASRRPFHAVIGIDDPPDMIASAHLAALPGVGATFAEGMFHGPPRYLRNRGRLEPMIAAFLAGAPLPPIPERRPAPPGFPEALHRAYHGYWSGDLAAWEEGARAAVALRPGSIAANLWLGRALVRRGLHAQALPFLAVAKARLPDAAFYFAYALEKMGLLDDALALHRVAQARWPQEAAPLLGVAGILARRGELDAAIAALEDALARAPQDKQALARIARYRALRAGGAAQASPR